MPAVGNVPVVLYLGDDWPQLAVQLQDSNGNPLTLVGPVTWTICNVQGAQVFSGSASIFSGPNGTVTYTWLGTELTVAGNYTGRFKDTGLGVTVPNDSQPIPITVYAAP